MSWIGASICAAAAEPTRAMEAMREEEAGIVVIWSVKVSHQCGWRQKEPGDDKEPQCCYL